MDILKNIGVGVLTVTGIFLVCALFLTIIYFTIWYVLGGIFIIILLKAIHGVGRDMRYYLMSRKKASDEHATKFKAY